MVEAGKSLGLNQGNAIVANIHNLGLLEALQRLVSQAAQPVVLQVKEANLGNGKYYIDAYQITATRNTLGRPSNAKSSITAMRLLANESLKRLMSSLKTPLGMRSNLLSDMDRTSM